MAVVAVAVVAIPVVPWMWDDWRRCGATYDRIEEALTPVDLLELRPPGAIARGERESHCDTDDHFASVGQSYHPGPLRGKLESYYRDAALRHGWQRVADEAYCFEKAGINLSLSFPPEAGGEYIVSVSSSSCDGG